MGKGGLGTGSSGTKLKALNMSEIRAYSLPNLLMTDSVSVTVDAPTVSTIKYSSAALVDTQPYRSCQEGFLPYSSTSNTQSVYEAYSIGKSSVPGDIFKVTYTFDKEYFQHAVLLQLQK